MPLQMDFLEHEAINDVIIMGVVLDEARHRNNSVYQRLRALTLSTSKRFFVFSNEHHRWAYQCSFEDLLNHQNPHPFSTQNLPAM